MGRGRKIEEQRALYTRAKRRGSANPDRVGLNRKRQRTGSDSTAQRRSESARAKRQQQGRRKESLFKKACEYSAECDAEVYLCVKIKRNGQIFFFNSKKSREWLPSDEQMVGHSLSRPYKG